MGRKVVVNPEDFNKIVDYIVNQPISFINASKAVEINEIIQNVQIFDIEFNTEKDDKVS